MERLLCPGVYPAGVRLYVEPGTKAREISSLWLAGFRVRIVRVADMFAVPGWWHLAAHRHHRAETRGMSVPRPDGRAGSRALGVGRTPLPGRLFAAPARDGRACGKADAVDQSAVRRTAAAFRAASR